MTFGQLYPLCESWTGLTVQHQVELLLTLPGSCEEHTVANGLLYPVDETAHCPLHRQVLLSVSCTDGRFPAEDTYGASGLTADRHRLPKAHHHPGGLDVERAAFA